MPDPRIQAMLQDIITKEGGYVNNAADRGGPTNWGVTQATLSQTLGRPASVEDVQNLTQAQAMEIYLKQYFLGPHIDALPASIQPVCLDICVNSGPKGMGIILQRALNDLGCGPLTVDGSVGPSSRNAAAAADQADSDKLVDAIVNERNTWYRNIVLKDAATQTACQGLGLTLDDDLLTQMLSDSALVKRITTAAPKSQAAFLRGWVNRSESFAVA